METVRQCHSLLMYFSKSLLYVERQQKSSSSWFFQLQASTQRGQRDAHSNHAIDSLVAINAVLLLSGQAQIEKANKNWFSPASCRLIRVWKRPRRIHPCLPAGGIDSHVDIYLQTSTGWSEKKKKNQGGGLFNDRINPGGRLKKLISWQ